MFTLACRDLGVDCDYVATGASVEEVKNSILAHSGAVHAEIIKGMSAQQKAGLAKTADASIKVV